MNTKGDNKGDSDADFEDEGNKPCKYFQILACAPGGIAEADAGFAKKLLNVCRKYS